MSQRNSRSFWHRLEADADRLSVWGACAACGFVLLSAAYAGVLGGHSAQFSDAIRREAAAIAISAGFGIQEAVIEGSENLSREQIEWALFEGGVQTMFGFDASAARERLAGLGWVRNAEVWRLWPSTIVVHVEEREAVARWRIGGREVLIDGSGEPLGPVTPRYDALAVVQGKGANTEAAALARMLDAAGLAHQVKMAERIAARRWDLVLASGIRVKLPAASSAATLDVLSGVLGRLEGKRLPASVDLRIPGRIALGYETQNRPGVM